LIGESRVGKTSIIKRFVEDSFDDREKQSREVQISRKMLKIDRTDKWAQLHIWDTLGQEKFRSVAAIFYKKAVGAFLVFDTTNRKSFEAVEEWYQ
jgi:small GTP-binding protein